MWVYDQKTGNLTRNEKLVGLGYSGTGEGRNNPASEAVPNVGPIPRGLYSIGKAYAHPKLGPVVMNLDPIGHNALGRTAFRIHGDNAKHDASEGCVILGPSVRRLIAASDDKQLTVV